MANRLKHEKSPYLLQHADNPVDWYPWSEEAFDTARREDRLIFLSIGYSTCHWCHVMAHESFEDPVVAAKLNEAFVSIKVDREERPDIDRVYMSVCQALTGRGGWPLSVFMTPDRRPFFSGTYFPRTQRLGMPGFLDILDQITRLWQRDKAKVRAAGDKVVELIRTPPDTQDGAFALNADILGQAYRQLARLYDPRFGGFGPAPKFPSPHQLTFLLRVWHRSGDPKALQMVTHTLDTMRRGGIFDQLGFGFHRYSVDERWLVPHFEKMLYDQAMLAIAYLETYQATRDARFAATAREIFSYVLGNLRDPDGAFHSAEDADSDGGEGRFYVWKAEEIDRLLDAETAALVRRFYAVEPHGNFEGGTSILHVPTPVDAFAAQMGRDPATIAARLEKARDTLLQARLRRPRPFKDDKILTSWNGLMIAALAKGYRVLDQPMYLHAARDAAGFILTRLKSDDDRLWRRWRQGEKAEPGFLDDYAFLTWGLLELYQAANNPTHLHWAVRLQQILERHFGDQATGGFFYTPDDHPAPLVRDQDHHDGALPSGNSVALMNMIRLERLTGHAPWAATAEKALRHFLAADADYPIAATQMLQALDFALGPGREIVITGKADDPNLEEMLRWVHRPFAPHQVVHLVAGEQQRQQLTQLAPYLEAMTPVAGQATAYCCERFACGEPITDPGRFKEMMNVHETMNNQPKEGT